MSKTCKCKLCSTSFTPKNRLQKYCSRQCYNLFNWRLYVERHGRKKYSKLISIKEFSGTYFFYDCSVCGGLVKSQFECCSPVILCRNCWLNEQRLYAERSYRDASKLRKITEQNAPMCAHNRSIPRIKFYNKSKLKDSLKLLKSKRNI